MMNPDIFSYIRNEESLFDTEEIRVGSNWDWNFKNHVQTIFHLKNGMFYTGENNWLRAFKNIMEPILNLAYWTEDIEVKDIVFYIEEEEGRALSFLMKKYHDEVYIKENNIDTLLDEITEDDVDYGGVLVQKGKKRPEVVFLPSIAFCDQTDIMGGPRAFKFSFSPDQLRAKSKDGWGEEKNGATISIEDLIVQAEPAKDPSHDRDTKKNRTTGKNIEVYIIHGPLPEHYLKDNDNMEDHYDQLQVVAFYTNRKGAEEGVTLFRKKATEELYKFHTSKKVYSRALGRGVGETMLHPQVWTNFLEIHKMNMIEAASKVPLVTDDENFGTRNKIQDMENLEITVVEDGKSISQIPTAAPANIQLFENSINSWFEQAQLAGQAQDPILGKEPVSGTTFRGQERTVAQGRGFHDRRRGQRAKFIEELYRDWIIPDMKREITKGKKFLATLSADELQWLSETVVKNQTNNMIKERILSGEVITREEIDQFREASRQQFLQGGEKRLIEILKDEFKDVEIKMGINIANKQKDLSAATDKILSIFQFVFSNPEGFKQTMAIPGMSSAFNDILEFSGISAVDFSALANPPAVAQAPQAPQAPPQGGQPELLPTEQPQA